MEVCVGNVYQSMRGLVYCRLLRIDVSLDENLQLCNARPKNWNERIRLW